MNSKAENQLDLIAEKLEEALRSQNRVVRVGSWSRHPEATTNLDPAEMSPSQMETEIRGIFQGMMSQRLAEAILQKMTETIQDPQLSEDKKQKNLIHQMQNMMD